MHRKRHFLAFLPFCALLASQAFADPVQPNHWEQKKVEKNTASQYAAPVERSRFFIEGDYLYWKTYETGLNFVLSDVAISDISSLNLAKGTPQSANFDGTSGARLAFGYCFGPTCWEILGSYTYFSPEGSDNYIANSTSGLIATYYQNTLQAIQGAKSTISLRYQAASVLAARRFAWTKHFFSRVVTGITGAWIHQDWRYSYAGAESNFGITEYDQKWKFTGVGLELGVDLSILTEIGLGLSAKFHGLMLYGHYHNTFAATSIFPASPSAPLQLDANTSYNNQRIVPQFQMSIGPCYSFHISGNSYINLTAAWELNSFWNLHETNRSIATTGIYSKDSRHTTNLISMQGLSFQVGVSF